MAGSTYDYAGDYELTEAEGDFVNMLRYPMEDEYLNITIKQTCHDGKVSCRIQLVGDNGELHGEGLGADFAEAWNRAWYPGEYPSNIRPGWPALTLIEGGKKDDTEPGK